MTFDLTAARAARDTGMATVVANQREDWHAGYRREADAFLSGLRPGTEFIGEDLRVFVSTRIGEPDHPNAWGAMARAALARWLRNGDISLVGVRSMTRKASHARLSPCYVVRYRSSP